MSNDNFLSAGVNNAVPQRRPGAPPPPPKVIRPPERTADTEEPEKKPAPVVAPQQEDTPARMHARTQTPENTGVSTPKQTQKSTNKQTSTQKHMGRFNVEALYEQIRDKKHLSTGTFRYKAEELQEMENIYKLLDDQKPGRMSKNDIARLALIYLCEDFRNNGDASLLEQMLKRM
jgi:hypothetical protein